MVYSSNANAAMQMINTKAVGNTSRGFGMDLFNANKIEKENFERAEQSANNQFYRDLALQYEANEYNSREAQKNRDFQSAEAQKNRDYQERLSATAYQRAVEDLKKAGLNPILAYGNGGADLPSGGSVSGAQASSSSARSSGGHSAGQGVSNSNGLLNFVASLIGTGASIANGLISGRNAMSRAVMSANRPVKTTNHYYNNYYRGK